MYVLLVYDIATNDSGVKRQRKIFKICKKYLNRIQNSVFEGELTNANLEQLKRELKQTIDVTSDSVIVFESREKK